MMPSGTAECFFLRDLPAAIAAHVHRYRALHGTLAFSCAGRKWTVRLGDLEAPIVERFDRDADVKIWFFGDAFERWRAGEVVSGKKLIRLEGDADVLERFGLFLQPSRSSLSVRFRAD